MTNHTTYSCTTYTHSFHHFFFYFSLSFSCSTLISPSPSLLHSHFSLLNSFSIYSSTPSPNPPKPAYICWIEPHQNSSCLFKPSLVVLFITTVILDVFRHRFDGFSSFSPFLLWVLPLVQDQHWPPPCKTIIVLTPSF